jgi:RHS repeat-associated protein
MYGEVGVGAMDRRVSARGGKIRALITSLLAGVLVVGVPGQGALAAQTAGRARAALASAPVQASGSAAGRSHRASTAQTRSTAKAAGSRPGQVKGALAPFSFKPPVRKPVRSGGTQGKASTRISVVPPKVKATAASPGTTAWSTPPGTKFDSSLSSADTQVFVNGAGSDTARVYATDVDYRLPSGQWAPIDPDLVAGDGRYREQAAGQPISFAADGSAADLMTLQVDATHAVSFGLSGAAAVAPTISGAQATYAGIQPGVDLQVSATATGLKESLVLHSAADAGPWFFPIDSPGLTARPGPAGSIELVDGSGTDRIDIPAGFMEDSSLSAAGHQGAVSTGVQYRLVTVQGHAELELEADKSWLTAPSRVFPVILDPTSLPAHVNPAASTFVQTGDPGPHENGSLLDTGVDTAGQQATTYLSFNSLDSGALANAFVSSASLNLYNVESGSCAAQQANVSQVLSSWNPATLASPPGPAYSSSPLAGGAASGGVTPGGIQCTGGQGAWEDYGFNASGLSMLDGWTHNQVSNYGLAVWASQTNPDAWKEFAGASSAQPPYLEVNYSPYGDSINTTNDVWTTAPTGAAPGVLSLTLTNTGSATWGSAYSLVSTQEAGTGGVLTTTRVTLPTVAPGNSTTVAVSVPPQVTGPIYALQFDVSGPGSPALFSAWGVPTSSLTYENVNVIPQLDVALPLSDATVDTLTPTLYAQGHDPDRYPDAQVQYYFEMCNGTPDVPTNCTSSGFLPAGVQSWQPPLGQMAWNQTSYWWVQVWDGEAFSAEPVVSYLTPVVSQQDAIGHLGSDSDDHGLDPETGDYTTTATDASVQTAGPALSIVRTYNSFDPSTADSFGTGWSSILDMKAVAVDDSADMVVTMPDGVEERYAANPDGTYTSPQGTSALLIALPGGYTSGVKLVDGSGTVYLFNEEYGTEFLLTSITDADGMSETFTYNANYEISQITNQASQRTLTIAWTPIANLAEDGQKYAHVTEVSTQPATPSNAATAEVWTYTYTGDSLATVCAPVQQAGGCKAVTTYGYTAGSQYSDLVTDSNPYSYWRLSDPAQSTIAASQELQNEGNDDGYYSGGVTTGVPGPLTSGATAASFNGSTGLVSLDDVVPFGGASAIEFYFKTSTANQVLLSYSQSALTPGGTTNSPYTPMVYIGSDGCLNAEFWYDLGTQPIKSICGGGAGGEVDDGSWHQVVITTDATGASQTLYLDGAAQGSVTGGVSMANFSSSPQMNFYIGGGYIGGGWPDESDNEKNGNEGYASYFNGSIAEVSFYRHALDSTTVAEQHAAQQNTAHLLSSITMPSGDVYAQVAYNAVSERATSVIDQNGETWKVGAPSVSGSTALYRGAVLGSLPSGYWQLSDQSGLNAYNEVDSGYGTYNNVTLSGASPFPDSVGTGAQFNGTSSYLTLPDGTVPAATVTNQGTANPDPLTIELWFETTSDNEVLFATQQNPLGEFSPADSYTPVLYVGADGKLVGNLDFGVMSVVQSNAAVNDGKWHQAVLTLGPTNQSLYVDGELQQSGPVDPVGLIDFDQSTTYVGAGDLGVGPGDQYYPDQSDPTQTPSYSTYFNGGIAELAVYRSVLTSSQVGSHFRTYGSSNGLEPLIAVNETDPDDTVQTYRYDPLDNGRLVSTTDPTGATTSYDYDTSGFLESVLDPNGNATITQHDAQGNVVAKTTCQSTAQQVCSTDYYTYVQGPPVGQNVALGADVSDSSSTVVNGWSPYYLTNGVVTPTSTVLGYSSAVDTTGAPEWVQVTLEAQSLIDRVDLFPRDDNQDPGGCFPSAFTIQVESATGTWTTVANETNYPAPLSGNDQTFTFAPTEAIAIKVTGTTLRTDQFGSAYMQFLQLEASDDDPDPANNQMATSSDGRSSSSSDPTYQTSYTYNSLGQLTRVVQPAVQNYPNGLTSQTYYSTSATAAQGGGTTPPGLVTSTVDPDGGLTGDFYFSDGDLAAQRDPSGLVTDYTYDGLGRVLTKTVSNQKTSATGGSYYTESTTSYTYDADGRVLTETDPTISDVLTEGIGHTPVTTYTYDADGNLVQQQTVDSGEGDVTRTLKWVYDSHDRLSQETDAAGDVTKYAYTAQIIPPTGSSYSYSDPDGEPVQETSPDGNVYQYTYDSDGRLLTTSLLNYTGAPYSPSAAGTLVQDSRAYDPAGRLSSDTNAMGDTITYTYYDNDLQHTETATGPTNGSAVMDARTYDAAGNLLTEAQDGGIQNTSYLIDAAGRVVGSTGPSGTTSLTLDGDGDILAQSVSGGADPTQTTNYTYDPTGHPTSETVLDGSASLVTTWTLDQAGDPERMVDPNGATTTYDFDPAGYMDQECAPTITTGLGTSSQPGTEPCIWIGHDSYGDVDDVDLPDNINAVTWYGYDGDGRLIGTTQPEYTPPGSSTLLVPTTSVAYDGDGNPLSKTDALGNVTSYTYNQLGQVATQTNPPINGSSTGGTTSYAYDALGQQTQSTDPTGAVTDSTYDYLGHPATSTTVVRSPAAADTTDYSYDPAGDLLSYSTPDQVATGQLPPPIEQQNTYNGLGEPTSTTDAVGNVTSYTYGIDGALDTVTAPDRTVTANVYDAAGRKTATELKNAGGTVESTTGYGYDSDGNLTSVTDPDGNATDYSYDADGNLVKQVQPVSATSSITTQFGYDAAGDEIDEIDGDGNLTQETYNVLGLPETVLDPAVNSVSPTRTIAYDADGRPVKYTEPGGVTLTDAYNALGDVTSQSGVGGEASTATRSLGYDLDGRLTSASAGADAEQFGYDDRGLLTSASLTIAGSSTPITQTDSYNGDGLMSAQSNAAGSTGYSYDADDRLSGETDPLTGAASTFTYTPNSQLSEIYYGSSTTSGILTSAAHEVFGYNDPRHDLTSASLTLGGSSTPITQTYSYNGDGDELTSAATGLSGPSSNTYQYDEADRLTSWANGTSTTGYSYDADGNRTAIGSESLTYNADDQLTQSVTGAVTTAYTYDAAGNVVSQTGTSAESMTYDAFGQMASEGSMTFGYDALGRLATSGRSQLQYSGTGNQLVSDGSNLYSRLPDGTLMATSAVGAPADSGVDMLTDVHGDVVGEFDQSGAALAGSIAFDPLGNVDGAQGSFGGDLGYQGGYTAPSGKVATASRWYNPVDGQFDSRDADPAAPLGSSAAGNRYAYGDDDPMTESDPSGTSSIALPGPLSWSARAGESAAVDSCGSLAVDAFVPGPDAASAGACGASAADVAGSYLIGGIFAMAVAAYNFYTAPAAAEPITDTIIPFTLDGITYDYYYNPDTGQLDNIIQQPTPTVVSIAPPVPCPVCIADTPAVHPDVFNLNPGPGATLPGNIALDPAPLPTGINPAGIAIAGENPYTPLDAEPDQEPDQGGDTGIIFDQEGSSSCAENAPPDAQFTIAENWESWAVYEPLGPKDRSQGVEACMAGTPRRSLGSDPQSNIVGYAAAAKDAKAAGFGGDPVARCHLLAQQFGGSGGQENLAPCFQTVTNTGQLSMREFEYEVEQLLNEDLTVEYIVTPQYKNDKSTVPESFIMSYQAWNATGQQVIPFYSDLVLNSAYISGSSGPSFDLGN